MKNDQNDEFEKRIKMIPQSELKRMLRDVDTSDLPELRKYNPEFVQQLNDFLCGKTDVNPMDELMQRTEELKAKILDEIKKD